MSDGLGRRAAHRAEGLGPGGIDAERPRTDDNEHLIARCKRNEENARGVSEPHQREEHGKQYDLGQRISNEEERTARQIRRTAVSEQKSQRKGTRDGRNKAERQAPEAHEDVPPEFRRA